MKGNDFKRINRKFIISSRLPGWLRGGLVCGVICFSMVSVQAQISDSDGVWETATGAGNWSDDTKWVDGNIAYGDDHTATLSGLTGVTITLTEAITISNISTVGWTHPATSWVIASSGSNALILATTVGKNPNGQPLFNLGANNGNTALTISGILAGTQGFEKTGTGRLVISNVNNTFTGGIRLSQGQLYTSNAASLNNNTITLSGGGWLLYATSTTNGAYTSNVVIAGTTGISLGATTNNKFFSYSGTVSESGGTRDFRITSNGGNQHIRLLSGNTYTGNTLVNSASSVLSVVVRAEHNNAFGLGNSAVILNGIDGNDFSAVELANNVTISNKTFDFRGKGRDAAGSLRSVSGNNTWEGNITTGTFGDATVGVDADRLTLSGILSGTGAGGLTKVGEGTLVLTNDNTYTNGTTVNAGTVRVEHNDALAGGALALGDGTGTDTLNIASGVALNLTDLTLTSSSNFVFELNGVFDATQVNVSGNQLGNTTYTVDILDNGIVAGMYTLLQVTGSYGATDFVLGTPNANYSLDWTEGTLYLNVIPEPSALILLGLGLSASVMQRSRRKNG